MMGRRGYPPVSHFNERQALNVFPKVVPSTPSRFRRSLKGEVMASGNLNLHSGGHLISVEDLRSIKAPPPEGRWFPVSHGQVYDRVRETLDAAGYQVATEKLAVH